MRTSRTCLAITLTLAIVAPVSADDLPGTGADVGKTVIYRDTWGIPHIYAPTDEAGLYAQGYAMTEDRPDQMLLSIAAAIGELSKAYGEAALQNDLRSHMFDHYGVAKRNWNTIPDELQRHLYAFRDGINAFYEAHPEDKPAWWGDRPVDEYMLVAFGRLFLYNWSIDEAYEDLERGGIDPGYEPDQRGSNQFVVAPSRSAEGAAILAIDPHLAWFGTSRFWEFRIHAGELHGSGVTLPGSPYIGLGHNADLAWAMTTGGPDTADIYELTLNEDGTKYQYDGEWKELTNREVTITVRGKGDTKHTLWYSHHGPIVAWQDGKAYAAATSYAEIANSNQAWYELNYAKDYTGAVRAMDTLTVFPQNVMVADTAGNIYYQRTGRVPVRDPQYDWSRPVDGSTSKTEWQGIHPASDHLQVLNPPQGYMQNCNIPPDAMVPDSAFSLDDHPGYLYSGPGYGPARAGWTNQRGARAIELLSADDSVTAEEAMEYINDIHVFGVERWQHFLENSLDQFGAGGDDIASAVQDVVAWDGYLRRDSTGALKYWYWRRALAEELGEDGMDDLEESVDDWYAIVEQRPQRDLGVSDEHRKAAVAAFEKAIEQLHSDFGSSDATWGDKFRVGRDDKSWPVAGGGDFGTRTLRSMTYGEDKPDKTRWGRGGQTSTQVVVLSKPIKSWIYIPIGQSDRKDSPHYTDQAEKLFSEREMKSSWWTPEELQGHIASRTVLDGAPGSE